MGLTFKNIHSDTLNLIVKSVNRQLFPDVTRYTQSVPGLDGVIDYGGDTYGSKQIGVLLQYNHRHNMTNLMEQSEKIGAWLYNDGQYHDLIFDDQPTRVYKAKMATKVDLSPGDGFSVSFVCNPPWPYVDGVPLTPADILWTTAEKEDNQFIQEFTESGYMRFVNQGSLPVKPIIKLTGNIPTGLTLAYGAAEWQYNAAIYNDGIVINCESETVTRMSDGENLLSNVEGDFFELATGNIQLDLTATGLYVWPDSVTVLVDMTPQEVQ